MPCVRDEPEGVAWVCPRQGFGIGGRSLNIVQTVNQQDGSRRAGYRSNGRDLIEIEPVDPACVQHGAAHNDVGDGPREARNSLCPVLCNIAKVGERTFRDDGVK